jgi:hypothetical protein
MIVKVLLSLAAAAAIAAPLRAQFEPGRELTPPAWTKWAHGEPVAFGDDAAPACTVYAFYTWPRDAASFRSDAPYLSDLQRRFDEKGLKVVAVVPEAPTDKETGWATCRIVVDPKGDTATTWFGADGPPGHVIAVDQKGRVMFCGRPESGLVDAVESTLAGRQDVAREMAALAARFELASSFDDIEAAVVKPQLEAALAHAPRDGALLGLLYLTQATKFSDSEAAAKVRELALSRLAAESRPLAAFADLALRGDVQPVALARELVGPLQTMAKAAPEDVAVQLACLRALVLAGESREVGRHAMRMQRVVLGSADSCLDFVSILLRDADAVIHRDVAMRVLTKAEELKAPTRLVSAARYGVLLRCAEDHAGAKAVMDTYLGDTDQQRVSMNNDCWYLMTELPTMGRYDWFAAGLAERMLEQRGAMDYFEFDTVALAMFLVGRVDEAVELQGTAIDKGGKGNPEYVERLRRYQARAGAAPR